MDTERFTCPLGALLSSLTGILKKTDYPNTSIFSIINRSMLKSNVSHVKEINSIREVTAEDDVSSIPYRPLQINYMRDVFRRKAFVKQSVQTEGSLSNSEGTPSNPIYKSIYDGLDIKEEQHPLQASGGLSEEEKQQADKLFQRILEIEKEHESKVQTAIVPDSVSPEFSLSRCDCPECTPRFLEDGSLYCDLCKVPLYSEDWFHHQYSISHQFKRKLDTNHYINSHMLPTSTAVKWMQSMGWKEGEGLGSNGRGRLEPIPTRMKNNRLGVGAKEDT